MYGVAFLSESELSPMRRALRARQERMQQSALELQRQVRRFRNNMQRITGPTCPRPEAGDGDETPEQVQG